MSVYIDSIINNALSTANNQTSAASNAAQQTISASQGSYVSSPTFTYGKITAREPGSVPTRYAGMSPDVLNSLGLSAATDPWSDLTVENSTLTYEAQRDQLIGLLSDQLADFFTQYYPLASDAFDEATNWLVNTITNGGTGMNPAIEAQIWQRDRDRVIAEGARAESQTLSEFAGRGFSLPPGAAAARLQAIKAEQLGSLQAQSRDVAIKQAEIEVENMRFAVEQAIKSRMQAMNAATDYIRALMSAPDTAARVAALNSDARARMMSASADMYRARLSRDELEIRAGSFNAELATKASIANMTGFYQGVDARVRAAASAAEVYGRSAAAALSSLSSVASASTASFG